MAATAVRSALIACFLFALLADARPVATEETSVHYLSDWQEFPQADNYTDTIEKCQRICDLPVNGWPEVGCSLQNETITGSMCPSAIYSSFFCMQGGDPGVGFHYPGPCGCPNYCTNTTGNGICKNGSCECNAGWTGADCSLPDSSNRCSGRGTPKEIDGIVTCECQPGNALVDCSASVGPLPVIHQVIPSTQYSDDEEYGDDSPIFNTSTIATIHLTMAPEELVFMQEPVNQQTKEYVPASFWFYNGAVTQTFDVIGVRIKGGASRGFSKKSFKLSLNEYEDNEWAQQKKLALKAMQMDPSATREKLTAYLLYSMNAVVQRNSYAELFINDQFMGMYLIQEDIGNQYLKSRFGNDDGLLYKCLGTLAYLGDNPAVYQNLMCGDTLCYKPDSDNAEITPYDLLTQLIVTTNMTSSEFEEEIGKILDVDLFLRTLVVEVITGNWDGIWNGNNYFLYYNYDVNLFQYFRQDLDIAFGSVDNFYNMTLKDVYTWGEGGRGHWLIDKVLSVPTFRDAYTEYLYQVMTAFNLHGEYVLLSNAMSQEVNTGLIRDRWRFMDCEFNYYLTLAQQAVPVVRETGIGYSSIGPMVTNSIFGFMRSRISSALEQMEPMPSPLDG